MNTLQYDFYSENKRQLLQFLKTANERKTSKFCNLSEYKTLKRLLPLDESLKKELEDYTSKQTSIIDITQSDEEDNAENKLKEIEAILSGNENLEIAAVNINQSTVDDIIYSIKEHLETDKCISFSVLNALNESKINLDEIFSLLSEDLNFEEVLNFGISLQSSVVSDLIVSYYIQHLLIGKLTCEYSDQLQNVLNEFSMKYSDILLVELTKILLSEENQSKIFLQFISGLHVEFKTKLFRKFIFSCQRLHEYYIESVEILLGSQVEYNTLNKLIEVLSNSATDFTTNKAFGKLLLNVIKLLGKNIALLEQPLKHIIGTHKSIWKSKIQKAFDDYLQDSFTMSQSFRY